jgi:hypothetical protein
MFHKLKFIFVFFEIIILTGCKHLTVYPKIGTSLRLPCRFMMTNPSFCFSTYTFKHSMHPMVEIQRSSKYLYEYNALVINNIEASDFGFYACAHSCDRMNSDYIDYYIHPIGKQAISYFVYGDSGVPIKTKSQ